MDELTDYLEPIKKEPDEVKPPTLSDFKRFRRQYVTRELPNVVGCQHKFDPDNPPHSNCHMCWFAYFNQSEDEVLRLHNLYKNERSFMVAQYGTKFVNLFVKFMSTVVKMQRDGKIEYRERE